MITAPAQTDPHDEQSLFGEEDDGSPWTPEDACLHGRSVGQQDRVMFRYPQGSVKQHPEITILHRFGRRDGARA